MRSFLRRHPFEVSAFFDRVVVVTFAFPEETLRPLVSPGLQLDAYQGFGFITVAMVWTRKLRPAVLPEAFGQDFFLAGFRIFTRFEAEGRRLRGLQILRSETDRLRMAWMGNLLTRYHYHPVEVEIEQGDGLTHVQTHANGSVSVDLSFRDAGETASLPEGSPFPDWRTARQFAGPMPFTFSAEDDRTMVVVEGAREEWHPHPVSVESWSVALFDKPPLAGVKPILANAFALGGVPYRWKRGRVMPIVHAP